jgi:actin-like ATPase involved in cell morphogenesis
MREYTRQIVVNGVEDFKEEIEFSDYFTIRLAVGYEIGQKQSRKIKKSLRREGTAYGKDTPVDKKIEIIIRNLVEKVPEIILNDRSKYRDLVSVYEYNVVDGIYLYKFKNQRAPNDKEKSLIVKKKRKKI